MSDIVESNFLMYNTEDGKASVRILIDGDTCWMSQKTKGELFETSVANVNQHITHILEEGELDADSVIKEYLITAADGKPYRRQTGLTTWKQAPDGPIRRNDVTIARVNKCLDSILISYDTVLSRPAGLQTSARRRQLTSVGIFLPGVPV